MKIQLVNLSSTPANCIVDALRRDGIIAVEDHGIDSDLLQKKQQYDEQLFSLPKHILSRYTVDPESVREMGGYYPSDNINDTRHLWRVIEDVGEDPMRNCTPEELPDFIPLSMILLHGYKRLFYTILALIEESLHLPQSVLQKCADSATPLLNSWGCHRKADIPEPPEFRVDEHTDRGLLTILPIPIERGYEAYINNKSWIPVFADDFPPYTLLVHGGRTLRRIAGISPCLHRVVWTENKRTTSLFGVRFAEAEQ